MKKVNSGSPVQSVNLGFFSFSTYNIAGLSSDFVIDLVRIRVPVIL